jgi:hypothetical protein
MAEANAGVAAETLRSWLVSQGIVTGALEENVLGGNGFGHPPGPSYAIAVNSTDPHLATLVTNGVGIETGRQVAVDPQGESRWQCPSCALWHDDYDALLQAIGLWYEGDDHAVLACSSCRHSSRLVDVLTDPPVACGHLAITFWNWPTLSTAFIAQVGEQVGDNVILVSGKL